MNSLIDFLSPVARSRAYLDPGSGSILLQLLVAAALGAAFAVKVYWKKIKTALSRKKTSADLDQQTTAANEDELGKK